MERGAHSQMSLTFDCYEDHETRQVFGTGLFEDDGQPISRPTACYFSSMDQLLNWYCYASRKHFTKYTSLLLSLPQGPIRNPRSNKPIFTSLRDQPLCVTKSSKYLSAHTANRQWLYHAKIQRANVVVSF